MKTFTQNELNNIIELHKKWLGGEEGGVKANLLYANLLYADLRYADLRGANLRDADLSGTNLRDTDLLYANLRDADLSGADLSGTNLRDTDLLYANLRDANLRDADLRDTDLRGADLRGANLCSTVGNKKHVKSIQVDTYDITYTSEILQIGCQNHKIEDWFGFDDETISEMDVDALEWWSKWKDYIKMTIDMSPAVPTK